MEPEEKLATGEGCRLVGAKGGKGEEFHSGIGYSSYVGRLAICPTKFSETETRGRAKLLMTLSMKREWVKLDKIVNESGVGQISNDSVTRECDTGVDKIVSHHKILLSQQSVSVKLPSKKRPFLGL